MSDHEFKDEGGRWVTIAKASKETGYSVVQIGRLGRDSKIKVRRMGNVTFVRTSDIYAYQGQKAQRKPHSDALPRRRRKAKASER